MDGWREGRTDGLVDMASKVETWKGTKFSRQQMMKMMTYRDQYLSACSVFNLIECRLRKWSHQIKTDREYGSEMGPFSTLNPNHKGPSKAKEDRSNYFHRPTQQVYTRYGCSLGPSTRFCQCQMFHVRGFLIRVGPDSCKTESIFFMRR